MLDISAAEEEITRWKVAAQQEADAGKAVEQEYTSQVIFVLILTLDLYTVCLYHIFSLGIFILY